MRSWRVELVAFAPVALALTGALLAGCAAFPARPRNQATAAPEPVAATPTVGEGAPAPDGSAVTAAGKTMRISDFRGKVLVLYFYPVAFAAGATAQAEEFRSDHGRYRKLGAVVVGVSTDDPSTHAEFSKKYKVPYPLLSDRGGQLATAFDVPLQAGTAPHTTFLIDRDGVIRKVWRKVRPWGHSAEVLAAVKATAAR